MIPTRSRALLLALLLAAACGSGEADPDAAEPSTTPAAGTAEGEVDETAGATMATLVGDIRDGIADLPEVAAGTPDSARQRAVRLYVTRQEVIEARWGPRAAEGEPDSLAAAVAEAERRHHRLMEVLGADAPDPAVVTAAVDSLDAQLGLVLERGASEGIE